MKRSPSSGRFQQFLRDAARNPDPGDVNTVRRRLLQYGTLSATGLLALGLGIPLYERVGPGEKDPNDLLRDEVDPCFDKSPVVPPFSVPLSIPPVLEPVERTATDDIYFVSERRGEAQIIPGIRTPIWGYNGITPGPTILARKGRRVVATVRNELPPGEDPSGVIIDDDSEQDPEDHPFRASSTVVHLHGINTDMISDGYPEFRREPGGQQTHVYPNNDYQRPATLWYHDHSVHITSLHVYRGLAAFYILTDAFEDATGLPGTPSADPGRGYGHFDIPLLLKDVMIAEQTRQGRPRGTLMYDNCSHDGAYGDVMTVNGRQQPFFPVANRKYRFRLLNGSDARQYKLALRLESNFKRGPNLPFTLIGTDQGLLAGPPLPVTFIHSTSSERHEFVIDFSAYPVGTKLVLVNLLVDEHNRKLFPIMRFDVTRAEPDPSRIPSVLRPPEHPADVTPPERVRTFRFDRENGYWSINGQQWDPARVDARPRLNSNEEWVLVNNSGGWGHPVHLHLGRFRVVEVKGRSPVPGELQGFKDTVWVGPNQTVRVVHQFWNFPGRFAFHCHNGSHEDHDMMSQFEVQAGAGADAG